MAPRPFWKGYLKLSLVSCPIALYPALDASERISFRQVNKTTGNRLRQQLVDSVTGDVVDPHAKGRGYEVAENQFVVVEDQELERAREESRAPPSPLERTEVRERAVEQPVLQAAPREIRKSTVQPAEVIPPRPRIENTRTIDIERFVPRSEINPSYHHTPYYIAPRDLVGQEAFAVIRDAMAGKDLVGMARIVLSSRERPFIVEPCGAGLRGITLRYAHEIRSEEEYFADIPKMALPQAMIRIAERIIETKTGHFDPAYLEDRYRSSLVSLLREKKAQAPERATRPAPSAANVVRLMDVLKRSLTVERQAPSGKRPAPAAATGAGSSKRSKRLPKDA